MDTRGLDSLPQIADPQSPYTRSCSEISTMLRSCLDFAHNTSDDPVARAAYARCSDTHWMRVTGIKWVARAHGDFHVAQKQSRCAENSNSVEIYWGEGRQVSDMFLHSAERDTVFRVLPCPLQGLNFTDGDRSDVPVAQPFLDAGATWETLFPCAVSSTDAGSSLHPVHGAAL